VRAETLTYLPGVRTEDIAYDVAGRRMVGHLAFDDARPSPRPAVLLCHEAPGLGSNVKDRAGRLATLGYLAFALDYQGDGHPHPSDEAMARVGALRADADLTRKVAGAGLDVLLAQEHVDPARVAAIGFCFGGAMALELARAGADLKAVVGFHPALDSPKPQDSRNIRASVLMCCGADDPFVPAEHRSAFEAEMRDAGVADWYMELYGGVGHSFTNPEVDQLGVPGVAYNAAADERSWQAMLHLLDRTLGPT
jgi:dienelactone hydrolase